MNHRRNLANRGNALKSTGPKSASGKRASSQNSRKHGLSCAPDFESSLGYQTLVNLSTAAGLSAFACADIAAGLLNYRRVMDAYYDTYTSPEPVNEFMHDMSVKGSIPIFREMLSESGSEPKDVRDMAALFASMQRQERRKGGPVSRRTVDPHKLIRYQRNGIARLSRAVRQG
jgi:hypothetical protein